MDHAPHALTVDASGLLQEDVSCTSCGYNLRASPLLSACGECGTPVAASATDDLLQLHDPWIAEHARRGVTILILAAGLYAITVLWSFVYGYFLLPHLVFSAWQYAGQFGSGIVGIVAALGAWGLTHPDLLRRAGTRRLIRIAILIALPLPWPFAWLMHDNTFSSGSLWYLNTALYYATDGVGAVVCLFMVRQSAQIALRLPSRRLANQLSTSGYGFLFSSLFLTIVGTALMLWLATIWHESIDYKDLETSATRILLNGLFYLGWAVHGVFFLLGFWRLLQFRRALNRVLPLCDQHRSSSFKR